MMITAGLIHLKNNPQAFGKTADGEDHMIDRNTQVKIEFSGTIRSVQPRSNVWRYRLDNRTHSMTGYNLFLSGTAEGAEKDFAVAISEKQMMKFHFHIGDEIGEQPGQRCIRNWNMRIITASAA